MKHKRRQKQNKIALLVLICLLCAGIAFFITQFVRRYQRLRREPEPEAVALTIGDETYSLADCNAYYAQIRDQIVNNAGDRAALLGLDLTKPLTEQICPLAEEGQSWHDYIKDQVYDQLVETEVICAASGEGQTLAEAETSGEKIQSKQRLRAVYLEEKKQSFAFSEEELERHYQDHAQQYAAYTYLNAFAGSVDDPSTEETCGILAAASDEKAFSEAAKERTGREPYRLSDLSGEELGDAEAEDVKWLTDPARQEGDTWVGGTEQAKYVLFYCSRDDHGFGGSGEGTWRDIARKGLQEEELQRWIEQEKQHVQVTRGESWEQVGIDHG